MLPNAFVWLDQLPLTTNGKVDREALPAPDVSDSSTPNDTRPPINVLELEFLRIWRRLFQREDISRQDNFFALGGHSLLAVRLAAEIDKLTGSKLPIATLFQSPTIESLARRLADENWAPAWSSLVPLQPEGSKPPIFLVHGWGGTAYEVLKIAKLLSADQPCYGIQAVGLDGKSVRHITTEQMATQYVQEIRSFQPEGPYYIGGYSMGGLIAFEVAQQLHCQGQRVALLAMLDSAPDGEIPLVIRGLHLASYVPGRLLFHLRQWCAVSNRDRISYLKGRWVALQNVMGWNGSRPPVVTAPPKETSEPPQVPGFEDYYHAVVTAYQPRRYPGTADIFVCDESEPVWRWYWKLMVRGGVSFHQIPGKHSDMILSPDHRRVLAKSLSVALSRAQEEERTNHSHAGKSGANPG